MSRDPLAVQVALADVPQSERLAALVVSIMGSEQHAAAGAIASLVSVASVMAFGLETAQRLAISEHMRMESAMLASAALH